MFRSNNKKATQSQQLFFFSGDKKNYNHDPPVIFILVLLKITYIRFMKTIVIACLTFFMCATSRNINTGIFENSTDVGNPKIKGSTVYDKNTNTYTLTGGGYNIWFKRDEFHYAYKKLKGDFTLTADFVFNGEGKDPHRKIGWMIRQSLADSAVHISAVAHGDGLHRIAMAFKTRNEYA